MTKAEKEREEARWIETTEPSFQACAKALRQGMPAVLKGQERGCVAGTDDGREGQWADGGTDRWTDRRWLEM